MNNTKVYMIAGIICLFVLAGCGGQEATPTKAELFKEPTVDVQATIDAAVRGTQAAAVTDISAPTNTSAPADPSQPTDTPEPTDTPKPTNTPEPTDTPEPAPTYTSAPNSEALHKQLTGTWTSDIMTVTFDWEAGTYSGVGLGELFERKLTLVSEDAATNIVVFKSDDSTIVCQILDDGSILLRKQIEGAIPVILTRASSDVTVPSATEVPERETAAEIIQAHAFIDEDNTANIIGVIENQGEVPLEFVMVAATLTDAEGNFLDTDFTYSDVDIIWPGQKVPFSLHFDDISTDQIGYDLTLEADAADPAEIDEVPMGSEGLEISDSAAKWDSNTYEIGGIVKNNTDQPLEFVIISGVLYDTNGHIMGTDFTYTTLDVIPPGGNSPFELHFYSDDIAALDPDGNPTEIGEYELVVEGTPVD